MNWLDHTRSVHLDPHSVDLGDRTYHIPCFASLDCLVDSIAKVGILNTPVLQERAGDTLVSVLGRRRLEASRQLGLDSVEVKILPPEISDAEGFRLAFWDNVGHRNHDRAFRAVVLRRLLELFPRDVVARDFLLALGVPPRGPLLERLRTIGGLEEPVLAALASGRILEKSALVLTYLQREDRHAVLDLCNRLRLNANKSAEIISSLSDLSVIRGRSVREWLTDSQVTTITERQEMPVPERAERFRELVRSWKYPELVEKERQFREWRDRVTVSEKVSVLAASSFKDEKCFVQIATESWSEAQEIIGVVEKAVRFGQAKGSVKAEGTS